MILLKYRISKQKIGPGTCLYQPLWENLIEVLQPKSVKLFKLSSNSEGEKKVVYIALQKKQVARAL